MTVRKPMLGVLAVTVVLAAFSLRSHPSRSVEVVDAQVKRTATQIRDTPTPTSTASNLMLLPARNPAGKLEPLFAQTAWEDTTHKLPLHPTPPPSPTPTMPPLPFRYLGKMYEDVEHQGVFLVMDSRVYAAHVGDVLGEKYRVDRIEKKTMTFTYLPLDQTQTLPIGNE